MGGAVREWEILAGRASDVALKPLGRMDDSRGVAFAGGDMLEAQRESRFRKRMPCRLMQGPHRFAGLVLNVSRSGLFVQTSASPKIGADSHEPTYDLAPAT